MVKFFGTRHDGLLANFRKNMVLISPKFLLQQSAIRLYVFYCQWPIILTLTYTAWTSVMLSLGAKLLTTNSTSNNQPVTKNGPRPANLTFVTYKRVFMAPNKQPASGIRNLKSFFSLAAGANTSLTHVYFHGTHNAMATN